MKKTIQMILQSWNDKQGNVNSTEEIHKWISHLNQETHVSIKECSIMDSAFWFYDDYNGEILNRKRSFFSIKGMRLFVDDEFVCEQPMIFQPEIGYLGIICKEIGGVLNFLMQAKIEPGNVNCVQISPTIQATKSNFTRAHGGQLPAYFDYFEHSDRYQVIYDQIQSEQASRFEKKRNRNIIMMLDEEIELLPNFKWLTLGQIKELMYIDNLVNMDTRTVISGLPFVTEHLNDVDKLDIQNYFENKALYRSIFETNIADTMRPVYQYLNNYKMFTEVKKVDVPLNELVEWKVNDRGVHCREKSNFEVAYYDIEIYGREVQNWSQPLFKAAGEALFGLISKEVDGVMKFLVKMMPEIGSFDKAEIGPGIQLEAIETLDMNNPVEALFDKYLNDNHGISIDVMLSEEGGRFYHEQNRNVIMQVETGDLDTLPEGYFWMDYSALNYMVQINNCLNIQLRNLMSLLRL